MVASIDPRRFKEILLVTGWFERRGERSGTATAPWRRAAINPARHTLTEVAPDRAGGLLDGNFAHFVSLLKNLLFAQLGRAHRSSRQEAGGHVVTNGPLPGSPRRIGFRFTIVRARFFDTARGRSRSVTDTGE